MRASCRVHCASDWQAAPFVCVAQRQGMSNLYGKGMETPEELGVRSSPKPPAAAGRAHSQHLPRALAAGAAALRAESAAARATGEPVTSATAPA